MLFFLNAWIACNFVSLFVFKIKSVHLLKCKYNTILDLELIYLSEMLPKCLTCSQRKIYLEDLRRLLGKSHESWLFLCFNSEDKILLSVTELCSLRHIFLLMVLTEEWPLHWLFKYNLISFGLKEVAFL